MQTFKNEPGIFIRDSIRTAVGRRTAYLIEYILTKIEESNKIQKLVNGFTFITYSEIWGRLNFFKNSIKQALLSFERTGAIEVVYLEEGFLVKIDETMFRETLALKQKGYLILQEDFKKENQNLPIPTATQPSEKTIRREKLKELNLREKQLIECSKTRKDLSILCKECRDKFYNKEPLTITPPTPTVLRRRVVK
ncbi:MAG: hypothetical protein ABIA11_02565 [Patescibacteria group bacterium]